MYWLRYLWEKICSGFTNTGLFLWDCGEWLLDHILPAFSAVGNFVSDVGGYIFDVLAHRKRHWMDLLLGLPAAILAIVLVIITTAGYREQQSSSRLYWALGEEALAEDKPETAEIYLQKALLTRTFDRNKVTLALARTYEKMGNQERTSVLMDSIAPVNGVGNPEAHLYLATQMAAQNAEGKPVDLKAWDWHIKNADKKDPYFLISFVPIITWQREMNKKVSSTSPKLLKWNPIFGSLLHSDIWREKILKLPKRLWRMLAQPSSCCGKQTKTTLRNVFSMQQPCYTQNAPERLALWFGKPTKRPVILDLGLQCRMFVMSRRIRNSHDEIRSSDLKWRRWPNF